MKSIPEAIQDLKQEVAAAAESAGRRASDVHILLVTKTVPVERIREAYDCGWREFGENRPQELREKISALPSDIHWHLIGSLQTNKIKYVAGKTSLIQSLDRPALAEALETFALRTGIAEIPCLLQINSSGEASKSGFPPESVFSFAASLRPDSPIKFKGVMTIGPLTEDETAVRQCFRETRLVFERLRRELPSHSWETLSMGMSGDFRIAIEEGATLIRVGSYVFGERRNP